MEKDNGRDALAYTERKSRKRRQPSEVYLSNHVRSERKGESWIYENVGNTNYWV